MNAICTFGAAHRRNRMEGQGRRLTDLAFAAVTAFMTLVVLASSPVAAKQDDGFGIETISTRADRVSGGDVLVKVTFKHDNRNHPLQITLNGRDVSAAFRPGDDPNTLVGLVAGLVNGKN